MGLKTVTLQRPYFSIFLKKLRLYHLGLV